MDTSRGDFPREAQRWGFEGWAAVEGAVAQDGRVSSARTVIAYPAFVFSAGAERLRLRALSAPTLTGDGQPCFYGQRQIRFLLQY